ncbi:response regulator [Salipiger abyssi]|uniref:response regulator n=1 Tax=Salipiger abyssi TaxID=1250539 RepID=UPI001A8CC310|nr:response regulator [Salipiger abyssi]MBN9888410.1 response regulator [Salipiger abyssi]
MALSALSSQHCGIVSIQRRADAIERKASADPDFRTWSIGLAGVCAAIALLDLFLGWLVGIDFFVRLRPDYPAMVPGTAICLLLGSAGTVAKTQRDGRFSAISSACGAVIPIIVLLTYVVPAFDFGPDAMSIGTAVASLSVAACLLFGHFIYRGDFITLMSATLGLSAVAIPLLGYIFNAEALFSNPIYTKMALHTAASFMLLFLALLLLIPETGWMRVVTAPERGSQMLRRLLPVLVLGPVALTELALIASRRNMLSPDLRAAVLTYVMIAVTASAAIYFAHLVNLSERRTAEAERRRRDSERARQAVELAMERGQRIESLGRLVGGVAHDFNNTLAVIVGNLELLQNDKDQQAHDLYVAEAISAANQAAQLTGQLLAYGRKSRLKPSDAHIDELAREAVRMFERLCPANITVDLRFAAPQAVIHVDESGFRQALLNILINARDAQPDGGRIKLSTAIERHGQDNVTGFATQEELWPGLFAVVAVADSGPGMVPQTLALATDPFFTTKPVGEGTGLGLSVASGFCRQSGGGLSLENAEGAGLVVKMAFPLADCVGAVDVAADTDLQSATLGLVRRILVVEDEAQVQQVMMRQLTLDGHEVELCASGQEALDLLQSGYRPDLVITDLAMPGPIQGGALSRRIRAEYPGIHVILMSGYESPRQKLERESGERFLQKPINWQVLREVVASIPKSSQDS